MISAETRYEMYDVKLLAIVETFKNWRHYLESCLYKVLMLTNHNNLRQFMDTKSLSSRKVRWAQELSHHHFRINYCQSKANEASNALSHYPQRSQSKEEILQAENTRIFQRLQFLVINVHTSSTPYTHVISLKHIIICRTHSLPDLCQSWKTFCQKLVLKA